MLTIAALATEIAPSTSHGRATITATRTDVSRVQIRPCNPVAAVSRPGWLAGIADALGDKRVEQRRPATEADLFAPVSEPGWGEGQPCLPNTRVGIESLSDEQVRLAQPHDRVRRAELIRGTLPRPKAVRRAPPARHGHWRIKCGGLAGDATKRCAAPCTVSARMPPNRLLWLWARLHRMGMRGTVRKLIHLAQVVRSSRGVVEKAKAGTGRRRKQWIRSPCRVAMNETYAAVTEQCVSGVNPLKGRGAVGGKHDRRSKQLKSLVPAGIRRSPGLQSATTVCRATHWMVNASARLAEHPVRRPRFPCCT